MFFVGGMFRSSWIAAIKEAPPQKSSFVERINVNKLTIITINNQRNVGKYTYHKDLGKLYPQQKLAGPKSVGNEALFFHGYDGCS